MSEMNGGPPFQPEQQGPNENPPEQVVYRNCSLFYMIENDVEMLIVDLPFGIKQIVIPVSREQSAALGHAMLAPRVLRPDGPIQ